MVAGFQDTTSMGHAYGVAVISVMFITAFLSALVMLACYDLNPIIVLLYMLVFGEARRAWDARRGRALAPASLVGAAPHPPGAEGHAVRPRARGNEAPSSSSARTSAACAVPIEGLFLSSNAIKIPEGGW